MEDDDDFIFDELIAAASFVEREHGLTQNHSLSPNASTTQPNVDDEANIEDALDDDISLMEYCQMPLFHCTGDDSLNATFHDKGYIRCGFVQSSTSTLDSCLVDTLFGLRLSGDTIGSDEELVVLFNRARMNIQTLYVSSRENSKHFGQKSYMQLRLDVTSLLFVLMRLIKRDRVDVESVRPIFKSLQTLLGPMDSLPIFNIVHNANCISGNESLSPAYHLLHGNLEWRVLRLASLLDISKTQPATCCRIDMEFQTIIYDLILLSISKFNRLKRVDLLYRTPFPCTCVKEVWLLVQLQIESLAGDDVTGSNRTFWSYFNDALQYLQSTPDKTNIDGKIAYKKTSSHSPANWNDFSTWLLCGVAKLQGYSTRGQYVGPSSPRIKDNYLLLDTLIRDFIVTDPVEDSLRITLFVILPLITEWWPPKTDILLVMWEYFNKKLNSSFYLQGSAPSSLAVVSGNVINYLGNIKSKMDATSVNPNETSFSIFTYIFGRVLKQLTTIDKSQINKIFGRIVSKFSAPKLLALNETGIHNLSSLFLTLAMTTHLKDTSNRLQTILLQMTLTKLTTARQVALVRGHVALIVLFVRNQIHAGQYISKLLEQMASIYQEDAYAATSKILADGMIEIFSNSQSMALGQDLLIGSWLVKHLAVASTNESQRIVSCVNVTITKIESTRFTLEPEELSHANEVLKLIYQYFVPYSTQAFARAESSRDVAELAANLCLNVDNHADNTLNFSGLFKQFTDVNGVNAQNLAAFLVIICSAEPARRIDESLIINKWIQCCMCSSTVCEDFKTLTNFVVSTNEFRSVYMADASELIDDREPLCKFFSQIGILYNSISDYQKRMQICDKLQRYLAAFDQYVTALLENPENSAKVFSMIAIIIFHCAPILYLKGKNACFFNLIMFHFILPNHVLTGRAQSPQLVLSIHKVWHMLILGIEKLDFKTDQHLVTITTNLIEKWIPHFRTIPSKTSMSKPFLNCIKECQPSMSMFVFNKITNAYLALQRRQPHAMADLVLSIYSDIINDRTKSMDYAPIETLLNCSCMTLIEHAMMIDDGATTKNTIFDMFAHLTKSISDSIRAIILTHLKQATDKHLAYFSIYYFRFVTRFAQISPKLIQDLMDHLNSTISKVEVMRGAGRDGKLRTELTNLEQALIMASF